MSEEADAAVKIVVERAEDKPDEIALRWERKRRAWLSKREPPAAASLERSQAAQDGSSKEWKERVGRLNDMLDKRRRDRVERPHQQEQSTSLAQAMAGLKTTGLNEEDKVMSGILTAFR